jgi:MOSC domain-containing protein YiiM
MYGIVEAIYLYPQRGAAPVAVNEARARAGAGLEGDQKRSARRAVTLLSREAWEAVAAALGADLAPTLRRANLLVSGADLAPTIGRRLRIGEVELFIRGETEPCANMDRQYPGLRGALTPGLRGGVYGSVEVEGVIRVGDVLSIFECAESQT